MRASDRTSTRCALWGGAFLSLGALMAPFALPLPKLEGSNPADLAEPHDRFTDIDGVTVRYRNWGVAPFRFLMLHGFGSHADSWASVAPKLATLGGVVAFDRIGFGLTGRPDDPRRYDADEQVRLARTLLDRFDMDHPVVIGHSSGAAIALALALDLPDRVTGLVLEAPSIDAPPGWARTLAGTPQGRRVIRFAARRAVTRLSWALEDAYHDPNRLEDAMLASYRRPLRVRDWDTGLARFVTARPIVGLRHRLPAADIPTLVVTGDDDHWVPTDKTIALSAEIPGAELVVMSRCGHLVHEECPEEFVETIARWLTAGT